MIKKRKRSILCLTRGACFFWVTSFQVIVHIRKKKGPSKIQGEINIKSLVLFCQKMLSVLWKISEGISVCRLGCNSPWLWKLSHGGSSRDQGKRCFGSDWQVWFACSFHLASGIEQHLRWEAEAGPPLLDAAAFSIGIGWTPEFRGVSFGLGKGL